MKLCAMSHLSLSDVLLTNRTDVKQNVRLVFITVK